MKYIVLALLVVWILNKIFEDNKSERFNRGEVDVDRLKGDLKESIDRAFSKHGC